MAVDVPYDTPSLRSAAGAVRSAAVIPANFPTHRLPMPGLHPPRAGTPVFALSLVLMLSQLDRGVITLLVQPIKRDLHLSDTQVGELMGFAFISDLHLPQHAAGAPVRPQDAADHDRDRHRVLEPVHGSLRPVARLLVDVRGAHGPGRRGGGERAGDLFHPGRLFPRRSG